MDPSALIFVALAVAWAAYLIPKALEHHEEGTRTRTIDRFSHGLRILARREPRSRRRTELVTVADAQPEPEPVPEPLTEQERRALRRAFARAARRRRRVLDLLGVAAVAVAATVLLGYPTWHWLGAPAALVLLWLVVCRRMRVREKRALAPAATAEVLPRADRAFPSAGTPVAAVTWSIDDDPTTDVPVVTLPLLDAETTTGAGTALPGTVAPGGWELQPLLVPTYVAKDAAPRSVRTIDLDSTGVFSAGRSAADSALVRASERDVAGSADEAADGPEVDVRRAASS